MRVFISQPRPTSADSARRRSRRSLTPSSRRARTGVSAPLIATSSGSPSTARLATSAAVDSLSITPPGGATDSIRWAIPTSAPIAV